MPETTTIHAAAPGAVLAPPAARSREIAARAAERWPADVAAVPEASDADTWRLDTRPLALRAVCGWLAAEAGLTFAILIAGEREAHWAARYVFYGERGTGQVHVRVEVPRGQATLPSISGVVHAADWHEREVEDLYGVVFEGHPHLGDFVLHDDAWHEGVQPHRAAFDAAARALERRPNRHWRPRRVVHAEGAFTMTLGPVYGGEEEAAQFLLETVGEDVIRAVPRLFYKYRAVEKLAVGKSVADALLLVERFAGTTAFAHALAYCEAVERIGVAELPPRARALRTLLAEMERLRHHLGAIERICGSTGLAVATSQAAILEEELLRLCCDLTGHRYLFGAVVPGGLTLDLPDEAGPVLVRSLDDVLRRTRELEERLRYSSSFLDRLEEVGGVTEPQARDYGLVGPVARASGVATDLRCWQPYAGYGDVAVAVPVEREGDGYARLRVLFAEVEEAARLVRELTSALPPGPVFVPVPVRAGGALGWVEAPRGAAFHWVRIAEDGRVARLRLGTPSFTNWHGFHLAAEDFAFQDFPIIMATFGLSVAENDR